MLRLLKIEFLKNFSYRPFKIFSMIYIVAIVFLALIGFAEFNLGFARFKLKDVGIYNFPNVWHFGAYIISLFKVFLAAILVFSVSQEFSNRLFKQNVIDGLTKKEFLVSKLLTIGVFSAISSLLVAILSLTIGLKYSKDFVSDDLLKEFYFIPLYFVKIYLFLTMFLFLTVLFKNAIFPFLTMFGLWIGEIILSASNWLGNIYEYMPLTTIYNVLHAPFDRVSLNYNFNGGSLYSILPADNFPLHALIMALVYILVFTFGTYWLLKKRDW